MYRLTRRITKFSALLVLFNVVGCSQNHSAPSDTSGGNGTGAVLQGEVKVHGSSTVYPISEAVAEEFSGKFPRNSHFFNLRTIFDRNFHFFVIITRHNMT